MGWGSQEALQGLELWSFSPGLRAELCPGQVHRIHGLKLENKEGLLSASNTATTRQSPSLLCTGSFGYLGGRCGAGALLHPAAVTKYHKIGGLKQRKFILSQFRRPESENRAGSPEALRIWSLSLLDSGGSRHSQACRQLAPMSTSASHGFSSVCPSPSLVGTLVLGCRAQP